jgi:hypothetical protein
MVWKVAKYVAFGSGNFPVGVGLDVFCPSAYKAACRFDWKRRQGRVRRAVTGRLSPPHTTAASHLRGRFGVPAVAVSVRGRSAVTT